MNVEECLDELFKPFVYNLSAGLTDSCSVVLSRTSMLLFIHSFDEYSYHN